MNTSLLFGLWYLLPSPIRTGNPAVTFSLLTLILRARIIKFSHIIPFSPIIGVNRFSAGGSMSFKPRASLLSLAIIIGLVFSAVSPIIVHADGGTPPEPTSTEATSDPTEVAVTPEPTEVVAVTEEALTADPQATEPATPVEEATDTQPTEVPSNPEVATATPVDQATATETQPTEAPA